MKDEWVMAAFTDDAVVAELLYRLRQSSSEPSKHTRSSTYLSPQTGWGHRRPRSKLSSSISLKKEPSATRCSPTTPLSWSGGAASPSDGACDDYSYSNSSHSHCLSSDPSRSKGASANDPGYATTSSSSKRSRKKTFDELKEEENLLLKERVNLTRELASLHVTLEEQRARSHNVKKVKVNLNLQLKNQLGRGASDNPSIVVSSESNRIETSINGLSNLDLPRHTTYEGFASSRSCAVDKEVEKQKRCFVLPDLNMMPVEEEIDPHFLSGIS